MLNINRKLSKKGFSLIELMVAVVILAIGVVGIFLAFSNTWMGMANARDRTVATNFAREAMENVKNMDFELVTHGNLGVAESVGAKFTRVIIVDDTESDNLKKIDTIVSWTNRQNQDVSVETSMYINRTIFNPGEATHIILYADPYYTVLPDEGYATIIAAIKDINNTTVIDWTEGNISFSIESGPGEGDGFLLSGGDTHVVTPTNGIAQTTFSGTEEGDVVIMASVNLPNGGGTISDTITITVTSGVVRIELSAVPDTMDVDDIVISKVTAVLVNPAGLKVDTADNLIFFNIDIFDSEGTLLSSTTEEEQADSGEAIIFVQPIAETSGVVTVTASSGDLLSGTVNIIISGDATYISVSVDPDLIYTDDDKGAVVKVEIQDASRNPVGYSGKISLATSDGTGIFELEAGCDPEPTNPNPLCFGGVSSKYTTFSSTSVGTITITASGVGLIEDNATIEVREALIADTITLKADPKNILAGGLGGTAGKITATIKQGFTVISNYSREITFEIISDTSTSGDAELYFNGVPCGTFLPVSGVEYGEDGVAVVDLKPATEVGICTIEVSTYNSDELLIVETIDVGFYSGEHHIKLTAEPSKMLVNGDTCTVTAVVEDEGGRQVDAYSEDITFTILVGWPKTAKFAATGTSSLTKTIIVGVDTTVVLIPQSTAGTVTLKASSFTDITDISGYLNIPVDINFLDLADPSNIAYNDELKKVSFDIEVQGTEISLEEMQVSWSPDISENLIKIEINPNSTGNIVIYPDTSTPISSGELINVDDITLWEGISNVILYFNESMSGKTLEVIFNPNSGNYPVEIEPPIE